MKADGGTIGLRRFVRSISVLRTVDDYDRVAGPSILSGFDGILGLGLQAGDWPPPALRHLTLGSLLAATLSAEPQPEAPAKPRPEQQWGIDSPPDLSVETGPRKGGKQVSDHTADEPRVRDVIRETGSQDRPERPDEPPEVELPEMANRNQRSIGADPNASPADHGEPHPSERRETDDESSSFNRTSDGPESRADTVTIDGRTTATESTGSDTTRIDGDEITRIEPRTEADTQRTVVSVTEGTTAQSATPPPLTVQALGLQGEPSTSNTHPGRTVQPGTTPEESDPNAESHTGRGPFAEPVTMQPREHNYQELESTGFDTSAPEAAPRQSPPQLTVRRDGVRSDPRVPKPGANTESTIISEDTTPPARSTPSRSMPDVDERSLADAIDIDRLTDRLYRALERKQQIERERRGL